MIEKETVLILGAGASIPYGFPSGYDLVNEIINESFKSEGKLTLQLHKLNFKTSDIEKFNNDLRFSNDSSIDAFLERRRKYLKIGKASIALCLFPNEFEAVGKLFPYEKLKNPSWYQYLLDKMCPEKPEDFIKNKLSIITFNYDRSLKYYLHKALISRYGLNENESSELLKSIPIIHVYGSLGELPWENKEDNVVFGGEFSPFQIENPNAMREAFKKNLFSAINNINILSEKEKTSEEFKKALGHITVADKIYFLGFGYNPINLERLKMDEIPKGKFTRGSTFGMGRAEIKLIETKLQMLTTNSAEKILDLFRDHWPLDNFN